MHTPCLLLKSATRKSLHDLTATSQEKLNMQTYKVFRREDHYFANSTRMDLTSQLYQDDVSPSMNFVTVRRHKIIYKG